MNRLRQTMKRIALAAITVAAGGLSAPSAAPIDGIDAAFAGSVARDLEQRGFEGVFAIARDGAEPIFGWVGENATPRGHPDGETLVDVGSITKTLTAAAALKLVDQGKLSPADRLRDFFPDAPADKASITVHQLLTHSSGLPGAVGGDREGLSKADFLTRAMAAPLSFKPGAAYAYSNTGYSFVAAIIEEISGMSYETYLRRELLGGRGFDTIGYESVFDSDRAMTTPDGESIANFSWGGASHWSLIGNGGLVVSPADMIRFRGAFVTGKLVSPAAVALAQTPLVREGEGAPSHYGYGMVVEDHPTFGRIYWHNGGNETFLANWTDYADHGIVVFTASRTPDFDADMAGLLIAEKLFGVKLLPEPN